MKRLRSTRCGYGGDRYFESLSDVQSLLTDRACRSENDERVQPNSPVSLKTTQAVGTANRIASSRSNMPP